MYISQVRIKNFRAIKDDSFDASPFNCAIGENNTGKSTVLIALSLFFSGAKLSPSDFYNLQEDIEIEVSFSEIVEQDILRLAPEQAQRIRPLIKDGKLTLTRLYGTNGVADEFRCLKPTPKDERFEKSVVDALLKGKRAGANAEAMSLFLPEYADRFTGLTSKDAVIATLEEIKAALPTDKLELKLTELPTGFDNSIKNLLPEPIYISAVKDLRDDVKIKESTTFGKLIAILLKFLEGSNHFEKIANSFNELYAMLNVVRSGDQVSDTRIDKIKLIEDQLTGYLRENFPRTEVEIQVPKPELKQIFTNAKILVDDGVKDVIETKGDGMKRAVTFALLRTYIEQQKIQKRQRAEQSAAGDAALAETTNDQEKASEQPYLFLFEEPELFLHPNAQKILFEALENLAKENNQVFVTTHSPLFFSPQSTGTFIKVKKEYPNGEKPFGRFLSVNLLEDIEAKDAFQIMCYENNAAAFFSNKVLLVEGDSDLIYLKEVSRLLNPDWNFDNKNIAIISINGKMNVKRFVDFYRHFEIKCYIIVDSDALIDGFEKFHVCEESKKRRERLLQLLDKMANETLVEAKLNSDKVKNIIGKYSWQAKYDRFKALAKKVKAQEDITDEELDEIDHLFVEETNDIRRQVFKKETDLDGKSDLLNLLRTQSIFILSNGTIEDYYPEGMTGADKPTKALNTIAYLRQQEDCRQFLPKLKTSEGDVCELEIIFEKIFE
jgi:putative ATP-dependent endonuclease of the OLD family